MPEGGFDLNEFDDILDPGKNRKESESHPPESSHKKQEEIKPLPGTAVKSGEHANTAHEGGSDKPGSKSEPPGFQTASYSSQEGDDDDEKIDFLRYLAIILRYRYVVTAVVISVMILGFLSVLTSPDMYKASTRIMLRAKKVEIVRPTYDDYYFKMNKLNTAIMVIKSPEIAERVIKRLNLPFKPSFLANSLNVESIEETNIMQIGITLNDPLLAAQCVNASAQEFINYQLEIDRREITDAIAYIKEQIKKTGNELAEKENALRVFQEENKMVEMNVETNSNMAKLAEMEMMLKNTSIDIVDKEKQVAKIESLMKRENIYVNQTLTIDNTYQQQLQRLNLDLAKQLSEGGEQSRTVKIIRENIENLKEMIKLKNAEGNTAVSRTQTLNPSLVNLKQSYNEARIALEALKAKKSAIEKVVDDLAERIERLPSEKMEYIRLERDRETISQVYRTLLNKLEELKIKREEISSEYYHFDVAKPNVTPQSKGWFRKIFVYFLLSLALGVGAAFLLEMFDNTIKVPDDVEKTLGIPIIGMVPEIINVD
ncbi:MAG: GumC family protein, partial [Fibrobacterota bacterium]